MLGAKKQIIFYKYITILGAKKHKLYFINILPYSVQRNINFRYSFYWNVQIIICSISEAFSRREARIVGCNLILHQFLCLLYFSAFVKDIVIKSKVYREEDDLNTVR